MIYILDALSLVHSTLSSTTPLMLAVRLNHVRCLELLLGFIFKQLPSPADPPESATTLVTSLLHLAARSRAAECATLLLEVYGGRLLLLGFSSGIPGTESRVDK